MLSTKWLWSLFAICAVFALARPAAAQTGIWSGQGVNNSWSTPANWQSGGVPPSAQNTAEVLTGTSQTTNVQNLGGYILNSLAFTSDAGPFIINNAGAGDYFHFVTSSGGVLPHIDFFSSLNETINFPSTGFQLDTDTSVVGTGSGTLTINGQLIGAGRFILSAPITATLVNPIANNHAGITINAGTLRIGSDTAWGGGTLNFGGGTLQATNNINLTRSIITTGNGTIDANGFASQMTNTALTVTGPGRLTLTNSSATGSFSMGAALQQGGGLTVSGVNNTVTLTRANTYSGGTNITSGGILAVDADAELGNASGGITFDGGTLRLNTPGGYNINRPITLNNGGGTIETTANGIAIGQSAAITGSGGLTKTGPGRFGLIVANTYTGTSTVNAGFLDIVNNQAAQNSTINLNGGNLGFFSPATTPTIGGLAGSSSLDLSGITALSIGNNNASTTYSGNLSGSPSSGLNKIGAGTWTLAGTNTQSGPFNIQSGVVVAGSVGALSANAPINLSSGATLDLNGNNYSPASATATIGGNVQLRFGAINPAAGAIVAYSNATLSNGFLGGAGQHILNNTNNFNNITTFNGAQMTQSGVFNLNNSTLGGSLGIGGTFNWTNGLLTSSGHITMNNTATFTNITSNGRIDIGGGINPGTLTVAGSPLILGGGSTTFVGAVGNFGGTINAAPGIQLNGALLVNNGTINGPTTVGFGSLAKGAGTYGAVSVTDGGKFSPGNSPGSVTTGSTNWNSGGSYLVEIADALAGAGSGWDMWNIDGILSINSTASANGKFAIALFSLDAPPANFDPHEDYSWSILHAGDGITGFDPAALSLDTSAFKNPLAGGHFSLQSTSSDLIIHFSAVPEPATLALFTLATFLATNRRRFR